MRMRRSLALRTACGLALASVLFVAGNQLTSDLFGDTGIDLTARGLYTVSPGTRAILKRIREPVTLKLYYSPKLGEQIPSYGVYAQRVRQLLRNYADMAGGKIKLEILDPEPYSETEDDATAAGLQGVPLGQGGDTVYFGLVGRNSTDDVQTVPFFQRDREEFLEYDLTKLVQSLAFPKKKVVGLITALAIDSDPMAQMRGQQSQPQVVLDQLRQSYDVRTLPSTTEQIPADVDVLMLVQPQGFSPKTEYAIDQFVLGGGHALVFADPDSEFALAHRNPMMPGASGAAQFDTILHSWGVDLAQGKLVGDRLSAQRVNFGENNEPTDYVLWLGLHGDDINQADPITNKLTDINLASSGALSPRPGATTQFETLLRSSDDAELVDAKRVTATPEPDPIGLLNDFKPTGQRYTLAARITGPVKSAFPKGAPAGSPIKAKPLASSTAPINVVVVADTDILDDRFWVQEQDFVGKRVANAFANNGDFVQNAVDSLAGTNDLITLRSRGSSVRPFTLVDRIRRQAEDRYQAHEKELTTKLKDTQSKLSSIHPTDDSGDVQLSPEQQKAVDQLQNQIITTRAELRRVKLALQENIDRLKNHLVLLDVGLVPLLVAGFSILLGIVRLRRRGQRAAH